MSTNGKGSKPRPFSVDRSTFEENWDRIFSRCKPPLEEKKPAPPKKKPKKADEPSTT